MSRSPMLIVDDQTICYGVFRHYTYTRCITMLDASSDDDISPERKICETRLPADFCRCGVYMLFEQD